MWYCVVMSLDKSEFFFIWKRVQIENFSHKVEVYTDGRNFHCRHCKQGQGF